MKQKPKTLPRLWRRKRDGAEFGAWHVYVRNKPVNLCTDDREIAGERRKEAVRGVRKWPRKFMKQVRGGAGGGADGNLAQLGDVAPESTTPQNVAGTNGPGTDAGGGSAETPPASDSVPVIEPEPIPQAPADAGNWAEDFNQPAGAAADAAPEAPPRLRLTDFEWFAGALVTASKLAVGLQLKGQAYCMRVLGDIEAGRVGPPPVVVAGEGMAAIAATMKKASTPWDENDPREPGRRAYERTIVALIPEELPIPAWLKSFEAPIITAINTAPVQWETGRKIERNAQGVETAPVEQPPQQEAPPGERAAA